MHWYNEPDHYRITENKITIHVTPQTDYWRKTHYGFIVDDAPFFYAQQGGEFEMSVTIEADFKTRFDQLGLMVRQNEEHWIKFGIEYVDDHANISAVVTHGHSDWSIIELDTVPSETHLKLVRKLDAVEMLYKLDQQDYRLFRIAHFPQHTPVMAGIMAASPDGQGFEAKFHNLRISHLPDSRRLEWLKNDK